MAETPPTAPPKHLDVQAVTGIAAPATRWASVASCLTPARAANVLRAARNGDADAYLTLAEEIEERDLQYFSVLQTRKLAVAGVEPEVVPGDVREVTVRGSKPRSLERRAIAIAEDFGVSVVEQPWFSAMLYSFMDAVAKGYAVQQPEWDTSESQWNYKAIEWRDPRFFQFDPQTLRELRLKSPNDPNGIVFEPGAFVVHYAQGKSGARIRGGLAMLATIAHVAKSYTLADWLAFCEVYGMPIRLATYDPELMTQPEIDKLKIALANIGHDAAAIIPRGTKIELLDGRTPPGATNTFGDLAEYWDKQLSKAVLGQTMTTDDGSSLAQAKVHGEVRLDLRRADAKALCTTVREQIIKPWVLYNYGPQAPVPKLILGVDPPEDMKAFTEALLPWVEKGGLRVRSSEIRARFALDAPPGDEDEILGGTPKAEATAPTPRAA